MNTENKNEALKFITNGGKCIYRYGWAWKGAESSVITKDEALRLLPSYNFGMGFYELNWRERNNETVLEFNELGENDMW